MARRASPVAARSPLVAHVSPGRGAGLFALPRPLAPKSAGQTLTVGHLPTGVAAGNTTAYVANAGSNSVSVVDLASSPASLAGTISVGKYPVAVALSPDGSALYVADYKAGKVSIVNTAADAVARTVTVGKEPDGIIQVGGSVYVSNFKSGTISVIDPTTGAVSSTIKLTGTKPAPSGLAASADGHELYVDDARNGTTDVVSLQDAPPAVVGSVAVGSVPAYLALDGTTGYVAAPATGTSPGSIAVVDLSQPTAPTKTASITVGSHPYGVATVPSLNDVLATNSGGSTLSVIDTTSDTVVQTVTVGKTPDAVAVTPDQTTALVANEASNSVSLLHINQAPVNTVPGAQTVGENASAGDDNTVVFSSGGGDAISTADPDAGSSSEQVTLSVGNGALTLAQTTGVGFSAGGNGTASMTFTGSIAAVNAALDGLSYRPATGYSGPDTLTFSVDDLGNSGDISRPETTTSTVSITVSAISTAPTVGDVSYTGAVGNTTFGVGTSPASPSTSTTGTVLSNSSGGGTLSAIPGPISTTQGGTVQMNADGTFTYDPPAGFTGDDTFPFVVTNGSASAGGTATVTVTDRVWYVDDSDSSGGNGTSISPFNALSSVTNPGGAAGAGDDIYLFGSSTPYAGGITLGSDQTLTGQSDALVVDSQTVAPASGANPTITNASGAGIVLGEGDTVDGITLSDTSGVGVSASGVNGFTLGSDDVIGGAGADGLDISGGSGDVSAGAAISGAAAHSVSVTGRTGGTVTLSGSIDDTADGVSLTGNGGAAISFTGPITSSTGANTAFSATGGGTVTASGSGSTLATTTGQALVVTGTAVGSAGLSFQSVSAGTSSTGPGEGIEVHNAGSGPISVTGTGTGGSGGTLQQTTADAATTGDDFSGAASFETTGPVSLSDMTIENGAGNGVGADGVSGLTISDDTIDGNGNNGINAVVGSSGGGQFLVSGNTLTQNHDVGVILEAQNSGTTTGTISANTVGSTSNETSSAGLGDGIDLNSEGSGGTVTAAITGNQVYGAETGFGISALASPETGATSGSTLNLAVTGNTIDDASTQTQDGMTFSNGSTLDDPVCLDVSGNTSTSAGTLAGNGSYDADGMSVYSNNDFAPVAIVGGPNENLPGAGPTNLLEDTIVEPSLASDNTFSGPGGPAFAGQEGSQGFVGAASCPSPAGSDVVPHAAAQNGPAAAGASARPLSAGALKARLRAARHQLVTLDRSGRGR